MRDHLHTISHASHSLNSSPPPLPSPPLPLPPLLPSPSPLPFSPPPPPSHQAEQCPYDAKGGFCPRMPLCKLEHTSHLATRPTKKQQLPLDTLSGHLGSPKRPHIDQPPSYNHLLQGAQGGLLPAYNRSVSLPFPFHVIQPGGVSEKKVVPPAREATPSDPASLLAPKAESTSLEDGELSNGIACQIAQTSASTVATNEGPAQQSHASSDKGGAISDPLEPSTSQSLQPGSEGVSLGTSSSSLDQGTEQTQSTLQAVLQSSSSPFPLPSSFNFYKGAAGALEEGVDANPSVPAGGGLFVFNSSPAEKDLTPGGLGVVPVGPPPPTATSGGGVISPTLSAPADASTGVSDSDVAALLAQQLALDSSVRVMRVDVYRDGNVDPYTLPPQSWRQSLCYFRYTNWPILRLFSFLFAFYSARTVHVVSVYTVYCSCTVYQCRVSPSYICIVCMLSLS